MRLFHHGVVVLAAGVTLACSQGPESAASSSNSGPKAGLEVLRAGLVERDPLERMYLLTSYLRSMGPEDVAPVLAEFEKHRVGVDADQVYLWMLAWTRFDGSGAFETARDWPTSWSSILEEQALRAWGFNDGRAALTAAESIEDEELRGQLSRKVLFSWVASADRAGATEQVATLSNAKDRSRLALNLAGQAKRDGADAVIAWVESVPEDAPNNFKASAFFQGSGALANLDPERAARYFEAHWPKPYTENSMGQIARRWAQHHDPRAAIEWIGSPLFDEARKAERADAYNRAFRSWSEKALDEVVAWIESASAGPARDAGIAQYARAIGGEAPGEALSWVEQMEDPELKLKPLFQYSRKFYRQDRAGALAWLEVAALTPERRQQIEAHMKATGGVEPRQGKKSAKKGGGAPRLPGRPAR